MNALSEKLFAATRIDGLGGRLLAMLGAKFLADQLGGRFGFTWRPVEEQFHLVAPVGKIFSAGFIERHWLGERIDEAEFDMLGRERFTRAILERRAANGRGRGWLCNDFQMLKRFREGWPKDWLPGDRLVERRAQAFATLGFSEPVRAALDAAVGCRLTRPMAALHLRSGDIVHGRFRSTLVFEDKVIPSTLARAIITRLKRKGLATLLVGQDRATLDYLKAETGALLTTDFGADAFADQTERAFFEMGLMARCPRIYAGTSVFATIAAVIGGVPVLRTGALFGRRRTGRLILEELREHEADYDPLEAAFGYQAAFLKLENRIGVKHAKSMLERALALDPRNDANVLKMAAVCFRSKDYGTGEAVLKSAMTAQFEARPDLPLPIMKVLTGRMWRTHAMAADFSAFFDAARAGYPYAAACSAHILHAALGRPKPAQAMMERALEAEPANGLFLKIRSGLRPG